MCTMRGRASNVLEQMPATERPGSALRRRRPSYRGQGLRPAEEDEGEGEEQDEGEGGKPFMVLVLRRRRKPQPKLH